MKNLASGNGRNGLTCLAVAGLCGVLFWGISCSFREREAKEAGTSIAATAETEDKEDQASGFLVPRIVGESVFPVCAVQFDPGMPPARAGYVEPELSVMMVAFADGRVIWSANRVRGGAPYYVAHVGKEKISKLLPLLAESVAFDDQALTRPWYALDSSYTSLSLCASRTNSLQMCTWHDYIESEKPGVVVREGGEEVPLLGRSREAILAQDSESYRRFRQTWSRWKDLCFGLVPSEGERVEGIRFEMRTYDYSNGSMKPLSGAKGRGRRSSGERGWMRRRGIERDVVFVHAFALARMEAARWRQR